MEKGTAGILCSYTLFHSALVLALSLAHGRTQVPPSSTLSFLTVIVLWHCLLFFFLVAYSREPADTTVPFKPLPEQTAPICAAASSDCKENRTALKTLNTATHITLIRASAIPIVGFLLKFHALAGLSYFLVAGLSVLFLTDFIDGKIARARRETSRVGETLDAASDYALIGLISALYYQSGVVPLWFFVLIITRLSLQTVIACVYALFGHPMTGSTAGGKATVAVTMLLYTLELARLLLPNLARSNSGARFFTGAEILAGFVIFTGIVEKLYLGVQHRPGRSP